MSDANMAPSLPRDSRRRDRGMTLPELLIVVTVVGLIVAVLSTSIVVTIRQQDNTEGRLNVARAEQSVGMWMPADLASADVVDTSPQASPCGATVCDGIDLSNGSNVLMLEWTIDGVGGSSSTTSVSYHFTQLPSGEYVLWRVECVDGSCTSSTVLDNLPGPPGGADFIPGVLHGEACSAEPNPVACTRPDWVIIVSEPLRADATDEDDVVESESERKDANRVIVTINGGGDADGAGGGINQISITAGGTVRTEIEADSLQGAPTFLEARSRCGGPIALVIDESNSISNSELTQVENGVRAFVEALAGTPVQIQPVWFGTYTGVLGTSDWHKYYDMTVDADVQALLNAIDTEIQQQGGTNWEDGLFRTFYNADGSIAQTIPDTIVFFTDGVPTYDRLVKRTSPGVLPELPADPGDQWDDSTGSSYSQVAFNRANYLANKFRRSVRFVGVGVGDAIETSERSTWVVDPGAGYTWEWERGYVRYQKTGVDTIYETNRDFERGSDPESRLDFIKWVGYPYYWVETTPTDYYTNNVNNGYYDGYYINGTRGWYNVTATEYANYAHLEPSYWKYDDWDNIDAAEYHANNTTSDDSDGYRIDGKRNPWVEVSKVIYDAYNTNSGESDGWRTGGTATEWISEAEYLANNTTPDASDGYIDTGTQNWIDGSQALAWEPWSGSRPGDSDQYRQTKTYPSGGPYDGYDTAVTAQTQNRTILARLIAGNDYGTPAIWDSSANGGAGGYTNIDVADMYLEPNWSRFPDAMQAIALGECGGTLTIQTKLTDGSAAPDPFRYQNSAVTDAAGDPVELEPSVVTTDAVFRTGTFDFAIPSGQYVTVEVLPQNFSELTGYSPGSWSCTAGVSGRSITPVAVPDSGGWEGFQVDVAANEAVSCTLTVSD